MTKADFVVDFAVLDFSVFVVVAVGCTSVVEDIVGCVRAVPSRDFVVGLFACSCSVLFFGAFAVVGLFVDVVGCRKTMLKREPVDNVLG